MAYWIFHADPSRYRILDALAEYDEILWLASQHQREIHAGDGVFLWKAGKDGGVYGLGEIATEPAELPDNDVHWTLASRAEALQPRLRVRIKIRQAFLDRPLLRSQLKLDPSLASLSI